MNRSFIWTLEFSTSGFSDCTPMVSFSMSLADSKCFQYKSNEGRTCPTNGKMYLQKCTLNNVVLILEHNKDQKN